MKKTLLMILDGWGIGKKDKADVIYNTNTPFIDNLINNYPMASLETSGEKVGLPDGQMGNSEVGHLNIGAGRIVYQDLVKINKEIENKEMWKNPQLVEAFSYAKKNNKNVHLIGLIGNGGVHALDKHMRALCDMGTDMDVNNIFVHACTDGRDTDPKSAYNFMKDNIDYLKNTNAKFASLIGRYFAMDRDNNWDRMKLSYDLLTKGIGKHSKDLLNAIEESYNEGITDEFIKPIVVSYVDDKPIATINNDDVVICFNYRTDRLRQMTRMFTQENHEDFDLYTMPLKWYTMTCYNVNFKNINVIYGKENIPNTLGEIVAKQGLKQTRIAETEKFAHVTFFFSGGREDAFENENRILIPSPKVSTYDLQPEMSAPEVTEALVKELNSKESDFICLNFANCDMVGHTGIYEAISKAVATVDECVNKVVTSAQNNDYDVIIIADHGNADKALNKDGSPNTAHTVNPVPCIWVTDTKDKQLQDGILADVAPTILDIMGIKQPSEMTGRSLIK